jgi:UDP-2,4-diacetamido-2,4,6-trideoxy-beta-L-altropyranose hydrolase
VLNEGKQTDWLVVDHYGVDSRWETAARKATRRILAIDDLADRRHDCDVLLDQNLSIAGDSPYSVLVPAGAKLLMGPRYALLRPEFATLRSTLRRRDGFVRRIMICFGGADPQNHTAAALKALRGQSAGIDRIDVVVGAANPHRERIAAQCSGMANALLHCPAPDIAELLAKADLAIGAGGAMSWERACLGVPTVAFGIAENQHKVLEALVEAGCVVGMPELHTPDTETMAALIKSALTNPALLRGLSRRSAALTDGLGAERVADAMFPASLEFRRATMGDADLIFRCRNDPAVRIASLDSREISRDTHDAWMKQSLSSGERVLLIAERGGKPQGVVRFDLRPPEATISVYRVPSGGDARLGLVRQATTWLRAAHPEVRRVSAEVLPANAASLAAFHAAGYRDGKYVLDADLDAL